MFLGLADLADEHKSLCFFRDLTWPRNIRIHLMFLGLADVHKLCTTVFKPRNVFSVMNIGSKEHKHVEKQMIFSVVGVGQICSMLSKSR
jgi:hypothetical protein